jgi:hypothetical protein
MGLQITILESAQLGVTIVEPFNVTLTPTAPATIDIEVGVPGASASVTVGTTTTLAPGLNATVTNVGTATNAILDFGIPAGQQGIQGIQGIPGPQGSSGVAYATAPLSYNSGTQTISIDLSAYATQSFVTSQGYITISALTPYLTSATAAATYYPLTNPSGFITASALTGYATESWVTSQGYLTSVDLTGYATESWVTSQGYITDAPSDGETYARKNAAWEIIGGGSYLPLAGGTMDEGAAIVLSTATYDSLVSGEVFGVELTADPTQNASLGFNAVTVQDGAGSMQMRADGLTFPDATTQTTAGLTDAPSDSYGYVRKDGTWSYSPKFFEVQVGAWTNLTSGQYLIADGSFVTNITAADIILSTAAGVGMRLTDASITFADATVQSTAGLSPATAATTYAPIAAAVPVGGATGQVLTKTSGTDYALSWQTPVVGDRYLTSSTTSNTVSNGNKTFTIGTGLSYTPTQNITISFDASNHMYGEVLTYNSGTGVLTVDINHHTGSGTYTSWVVNVGGVTPATSVAWGSITGTLSAQTDLNTALNARVSTAGDTMDNNALLEFNDTVNLSHLGINGNGVTVEGVAGLAGLSSNLNMDRLSITDGTDTAEFGLSGIEFADGTTQTTAYTGGATYLGDRISIYSGYLYNEDTSLYVTNLTLDGASTVNARNITLQSTGGGSLTFSDGTTMTTKAYGLPVGGTTGQVLSKINSADFNVQWSTASGGGGVDVQTFGTSSTSGTFTWTKPAGAKVVDIYLMGPGGGGGSGARQATSSARSGGGGGGSGGLFYFRVGADSLNSTESVVIGAGGAGGAVRTTDNSAGLNGSSGANTTFSVYKAPSGDFGLAGSTASVAGGVARNNLTFDLLLSTGSGGAGNTAQGSSANLSTALFMHAGGGGGGGGAAAASTTNVNGGGGATAGASSTNPGLITAIAGGAAGNGTTGVQATAGTSITTQYIRGGTGGGGGFYRTGQAGGTAGAGGWPGGGGGGGGASDNGFASGAGAAGAHGYAVIVTWY